ncbi:yteA family sporulation protein, partial [Bacillus vallismortis]|nr:yteA family sporulation protein [Bacillus vallismortis]
MTKLTKDQLQHLKHELEQTKDNILNRYKDNDHFQLNSAFQY